MYLIKYISLKASISLVGYPFLAHSIHHNLVVETTKRISIPVTVNPEKEDRAKEAKKEKEANIALELKELCPVHESQECNIYLRTRVANSNVPPLSTPTCGNKGEVCRCVSKPTSEKIDNTPASPEGLLHHSPSPSILIIPISLMTRAPLLLPPLQTRKT